MKCFDYDYEKRLSYLASLIEMSFPDAWYELSKEALEIYPVESKELRDKYSSFEFFEKAVGITLDRLEKAND